jgi:hypothetical protein
VPTFDCPNGDGEIVYSWQQDSQGVDGWAMSFDYPEVTEQTCHCDLPPEVYEGFEKLMADDPMYYRDDYEPPGL